MSNPFGYIIAGRGGVVPYKGTTEITETFYGFIPHQDMTPTSLKEHGSTDNVVKAGVTYKQGHFYSARGTYYTSMVMANADDEVDIVLTKEQ
jgi:hypothetical protein